MHVQDYVCWDLIDAPVSVFTKDDRFWLSYLKRTEVFSRCNLIQKELPEPKVIQHSTQPECNITSQVFVNVTSQ